MTAITPDIPERSLAATPGSPLVVAYGGGTNSTAMLCGFKERGIVPALIVFADTGGELPRTYEHTAQMSKLCKEWWGVEIQTVRTTFRGEYETLEEKCLRLKVLPSLAYGWKTCSQKFKIEPQHALVSDFLKFQGLTEATQAIGYDAKEGHRETKMKQQKIKGGRILTNWYPLIEWGWDRAVCVRAILRHNLPLPGKSSCFFCPAMKRPEIIKLKAEHPEYYLRALAMEKDLKVMGRVKGLYMGVPWSEVVDADEAQGKLFEWVDEHATPKTPCGCYDGGGSDTGNSD